MEDQVVFQILGLLETMQEACQGLYTSAGQGDGGTFDQLCGDLTLGLTHILQSVEGVETSGAKKLRPACQSVLDSLRRIRGLFRAGQETCLRKIEFELLPLLQEAYGNFYFFQYIADHPEHLPEYQAHECARLFTNGYIDEALERGSFPYEVSICVLAYNKLDYTKMCVESLLKNLPEGLNYELILVNHGSSDGTKEYFESIHPDKQLDIAVNGGGMGALRRIVEGEFMLGISNDVVVTPHAVENMLACIRSDPGIVMVVPTTPNVSNFQTIPAEYSSLEELREFALGNNHLDPFRWEARTRLCDPIEMIRSGLFFSAKGLCVNGAFHTSHPVHCESFPDDRISLLWRRHGYRLILAKDAYCHHFGSVTLKDEIQQYNEQKYYTEGRMEFMKAYGVDPWGPGFCYDPVFLDRVVGDEQGHVEVLGINCGLGSNALKIREQVREYCRNPDCRLTYFTDSARYLADLRGIGDQAEELSSMEALERTLSRCAFRYIVWEEPFLPQYDFDALLDHCRRALDPSGKLLMKQNEQNQAFLQRSGSSARELGDGWFFFPGGAGAV